MADIGKTLFVLRHEVESEPGHWVPIASAVKATREGVDSYVLEQREIDPTCGGLIGGSAKPSRIYVRTVAVTAEEFVAIHGSTKAR